MTRKKTVGEEAVRLLKNGDTKQGVIDTQREIDKKYFEGINECVEGNKSWTDPYFIVVHTKKEQLLTNVIRRYFVARRTLPTPQWDETVWRYYPSSGNLRFVWVLPDEDTAKWMASNPSQIVPEQHQLLGFVMDCINKKLYNHYKEIFDKEDVNANKSIL